jgi:hypothetical protein
MEHGAHGAAGGIEWEDDMVAVNRRTTSATMHWKFLDRTTGADSPTIDRVRVLPGPWPPERSGHVSGARSRLRTVDSSGE